MPGTQSLSNRSLASDPPRQFCDQMSLISSDNIVQKGLGMRAPLERYRPLISGAKGAAISAPPARSPRWGFGGAARRRKTEPRISMSKSAKKRTMASAPAAVPTTKSALHSADDPGPQRADRELEAIACHRVAAITHRRNDRSDDEGHRLAAALGARLSCGVVRKRLKLKLGWKKVDGNRVYQIASADRGKTASRQPTWPA